MSERGRRRGIIGLVLRGGASGTTRPAPGARPPGAPSTEWGVPFRSSPPEPPGLPPGLPPPAALPWRIGRSVGRTIYAMVGDEPSKADVLIGTMDTAALAFEAVVSHNARLRGGRGGVDR